VRWELKSIHKPKTQNHERPDDSCGNCFVPRTVIIDDFDDGAYNGYHNINAGKEDDKKDSKNGECVHDVLIFLELTWMVQAGSRYHVAPSSFE
jgi:hypothetical protein